MKLVPINIEAAVCTVQYILRMIVIDWSRLRAMEAGYCGNHGAGCGSIPDQACDIMSAN